MALSDTHFVRKIPITIVICDDDEDDRLLTRLALEGARIANALRFVNDGVELLDYLYQRGPFAGEQGLAPRPGLILMDLDLPNMDGHETLRHIREDPALRTIPVVVLTTSRLDKDVHERREPGVTAFIQKPVTLTGLLDALNVLDRYWLEIVELSPSAGQRCIDRAAALPPLD
jgi:CheY-like chemotaxis protein